MAPRRFDCYMVAVGAGTHPKFARLTDAERRAHFLGVLAVAAMAPERGCLMVGNLPAEAVDIASTAGVSERVARSAMDKLRAVGVLVSDPELNCLRVHDWDDYNPPPRTDATNAERQAKHRAKLKTDVTDESNGRNALRNGENERYEPLRNAESSVTVTIPPLSPPHPPLPPLEGEGEEERAKALSRRAERAEDKSTEDDKRLCKLLAELAKQRNPKFQVRSRGRWLTDMRLLRERDHNQPAEIERALRWVFTNPGRDARFWADVIQSPGNLREHFPRVWAQMIAPPVAVNGSPVEDSASFLARRRAMA